jgi:MFS transporter, AAHS family, 4-hydroxybenzoate transporter
MAGRTIDITALIDGRRLSAFNYKLIALSWLITVFDGFDMMTISYTAPYLRDQFHLDKIMLGHIFSVGTAGMLLGGFLFSWLGDWIGRRPTIVLAAASFGVLTILTGFAGSYDAFLLLRFLDGLAIGGMLPLAWALNIEFVPRSMRSSAVTVIMIGYSIGTSLGGPITVMLAPRYGWPAVYYAGGLGSLAASALLLWGLPESVRFLVSRARSPARIAALLARVMPEVNAGVEDHFVLGSEQAAREPFSPRQLFAGRLLYLTPLLWLGYIASSLAIYFIANWSPTLFEQMHFARATSAYAASLGSLLGALAGLALMRFTDGKGPAAVAFCPLTAIPVLLAVGVLTPMHGTLIALVVLSTMLIVGGHYGVHSIASIYYPTAIRASGGGWATSIAKLGGIAGPTIGGILLQAGVPAIRTFALLTLCPAILAACALGIAFIVRRGSREPLPVAAAIAPGS